MVVRNLRVGADVRWQGPEKVRKGVRLRPGDRAAVVDAGAVSNIDRPAAALWWPADRAWFIATEIEFRWTFVAGDPTLINALLTDQRLEVAPTTFDAAANRAAELN